MRQALVTSNGDDVQRALVVDEEASQAKAVLKAWHQQPPVHAPHLSLVIACTACLMMLYGYDFGITAWTVLNIKAKGSEDLTIVYHYLETHSEVLGVVVAFSSIGGTIGGFSGRLLDGNMGRRREIQLVLSVCIVGALTEGLCGTVIWKSPGVVIAYALGRLFYGFGLGLSLRCGPMYLREIVPPSARDSAMVSIKLSMVIGMVLSYIVGNLIDVKLYGYFGAVMIATVSLLCLHFLPESPHFMLLHDDKYSRAQVLSVIRFTTPTATLKDLHQLQDEVLTDPISPTSVKVNSPPPLLRHYKESSATSICTYSFPLLRRDTLFSLLFSLVSRRLPKTPSSRARAYFQTTLKEESWRTGGVTMSEKEQPPIMDQKLCVNGCGFFGSSSTSHMCSKCWKDTMSQSMLDAEGKKDTASANSLPPLAKAMDQDPPTATTEDGSSAQSSFSPSAVDPAHATPPPVPIATTVAPQPTPMAVDTDTQPPAVSGTPSAAVVPSPRTVVAGAPSVHVAPVSQPPVSATPTLSLPSSPAVAARAAAMFGATVGPAIGGGAAVEGAVGAVGAAAVVADAAAETPVRPEQKNRKRCFTCSKKVGYTGISCRCNYVFCSLHRYPEQHSCDFDFKTSDRNDLKRTVVGGGQFSKVDRL